MKNVLILMLLLSSINAFAADKLQLSHYCQIGSVRSEYPTAYDFDEDGNVLLVIETAMSQDSEVLYIGDDSEFKLDYTKSNRLLICLDSVGHYKWIQQFPKEFNNFTVRQIICSGEVLYINILNNSTGIVPISEKDTFEYENSAILAINRENIGKIVNIKKYEYDILNLRLNDNKLFYVKRPIYGNRQIQPIDELACIDGSLSELFNIKPSITDDGASSSCYNGGNSYERPGLYISDYTISGNEIVIAGSFSGRYPVVFGNNKNIVTLKQDIYYGNTNITYFLRTGFFAKFKIKDLGSGTKCEYAQAMSELQNDYDTKIQNVFIDNGDILLVAFNNSRSNTTEYSPKILVIGNDSLFYSDTVNTLSQFFVRINNTNSEYIDNSLLRNPTLNPSIRFYKDSYFTVNENQVIKTDLNRNASEDLTGTQSIIGLPNLQFLRIKNDKIYIVTTVSEKKSYGDKDFISNGSLDCAVIVIDLNQASTIVDEKESSNPKFVIFDEQLQLCNNISNNPETQIFSMNGTKVLQSNATQISLNNLSSGIYIAVTYDNGKYFSQIFAK